MSQLTEKTLLFSIIADETRVAWVDSNRNVKNIQIINSGITTSSRGNIYVGTIIRKEKALSAYFVDYINDDGNVTQGFLSWKESHLGITKNFIADECLDDESSYYPNDKLDVGQKVLIQIVRDKRDNKGAALTTLISLPGSFLVLLPNSPDTKGVSRKAELNNKKEIKDLIDKLNFPKSMGLIVRTAGLKVSLDILQNDLNNLIKKWNDIKSLASSSNNLLCVYKESSELEKLIRDSLGFDTCKVIIDHPEYFNFISSKINEIRPDFNGEIIMYDSKVPLFTHYQVQQQLESMFLREVTLPSGGTIVIDKTEALVAIDINSGKSTKNNSIEATALATNLEAAREIAKQLQLRDIGGIIVIDFIDMVNKSDKDKVEDELSRALANDNARTHVYEISKLGLLEMSRQRMRPSVSENNLIACNNCNKRGFIRSSESFSASIIHIIEENAVHSESCVLQIQIPTNVANYLWNNKASHIQFLENKYGVEIIVVANDNFIIPQYSLKRIKSDDSASSNNVDVSVPFQNNDLSHIYVKKYTHMNKQSVLDVKREGLFTKILKKIFLSNNSNNKSKKNKPNSTSKKKRPYKKSNHNLKNKKDYNRSPNKRKKHNPNSKKSNPNVNNGVTANQSASENDFL